MFACQRKCVTKLVWSLACGTMVLLAGTATGEDLGLAVPKGFTITRYADDALAHDIYSMTIDSLGRVAVAGPGYVKILIDTNNDGKADKAVEYADGPETGAQGMCFLGRDLLCTGDDGLILFEDQNGDDQADGPPKTFVRLRTGSEHNAHAVRRGPDGWWYLLAGNTAGISKDYARLPHPPVANPHGGVILRMPPDLTAAEVYCDGFRNAYDFDFNTQGEMFVYDSDGERDVSLPWYLPSRLFHVMPGNSHGWITDSWKRPDYLFDSAPVTAATGRSSPTGTVCYRHTQFPAEYHGSQFVLDWTFGRIFVVPGTRAGDTWKAEATAFVTARGQQGFAPTDIEVGPDGSLFVAVGGRGTHGTVYKITHDNAPKAPVPALLTVKAEAKPDELLNACLTAPQPNSSWSRTRWLVLARKLGAGPFLNAAQDQQLSAAARIRAIEILTELFIGLPANVAEILATANSPEVRARAAWSLGVKLPPDLPAATWDRYLCDADPLVRRVALESLATTGTSTAPLVKTVAARLNDDSRLVRLAASRLLPDMDSPTFKSVSDATRQLGWKAALANSVGFIARGVAKNDGKPVFIPYGIDIGRRVIVGSHPVELKLEAARVIQLALGDMGPSGPIAPVFDAYASTLDLTKFERELDPLRIAIANVFPTGNRELDIELSRIAAMLESINDDLLTKILAKLTPDSNPIDDIHYLVVAGRLPVSIGKAQREILGRALVSLDKKLVDRHLLTDNNWNDRVGELYSRLCEQDADLPASLLEQPGFGRPAHVTYLSKLPETELPKAIDLFYSAAMKTPDYPWNNDVVFVVGYGKKPEHTRIIRDQFDKFALRMSVLMVLSTKPEEQDRARFAAGLDSGPVEVLTSCVTALEKLPPKKDPEELVSLVKLLRRLGSEKSEFPLREQVVKLLERNTEEKFAFVRGAAGHVPQPEAIDGWTKWVTAEYPTQAAQILGSSDVQESGLKAQLAKIDWEKGDAERGKKLFTSRSCAQCHTGSSGLGPDLAGATGRFSREDLFMAIVAPNRDVSPRYQTILVETKAGKTYTGLVVYESVDGLLLRNGTNQTFRIEAADLESKRSLPTSLMPSGLMKDLKDADYADLYRYLKTLSLQTAEAEPEEETKKN